MSSPKEPSPIEQAMKDAVESIEARHREDGDDPGVEVEVEAKPAATENELLIAKQNLEKALEAAKKETGDLKDRWLRSAADLENYRKRWAREREEIVKFGSEQILKDLLPVFDDLDRTLEVAGRTESGPLLDGVKMVHKKFLAQLEKHGVTAFASLGEPFDPGRHEAVQQSHSEAVPAGAIAAELRRGFFLNGRLLRAAMVAISLGPEPKKEE